jgi:hypothetical protein
MIWIVLFQTYGKWRQSKHGLVYVIGKIYGDASHFISSPYGDNLQVLSPYRRKHIFWTFNLINDLFTLISSSRRGIQIRSHLAIFSHKNWPHQLPYYITMVARLASNNYHDNYTWLWYKFFHNNAVICTTTDRVWHYYSYYLSYYNTVVVQLVAKRCHDDCPRLMDNILHILDTAMICISNEPCVQVFSSH